MLVPLEMERHCLCLANDYVKMEIDQNDGFIATKQGIIIGSGWNEQFCHHPDLGGCTNQKIKASVLLLQV